MEALGQSLTSFIVSGSCILVPYLLVNHFDHLEGTGLSDAAAVEGLVRLLF